MAPTTPTTPPSIKPSSNFVYLPSTSLQNLTSHNPDPTSHDHSPFGASPVMGKPTGHSTAKGKGKAKGKAKAKAKGQDQGVDDSDSLPRGSEDNAHGGK